MLVVSMEERKRGCYISLQFSRSYKILQYHNYFEITDKIYIYIFHIDEKSFTMSGKNLFSCHYIPPPPTSLPANQNNNNIVNS